MKAIVAYPPVDFDVPFEKLNPSDIDIYFHYDSRIGPSSCKAACEHCYFRNRPTFQIPTEKALRITHSLRTQGYDIGMAPADSFSDEALAAGEAGSACRLSEIGLAAWSSGVPLYLGGWEARLERAWNIGFRSIIITAHDSAGTSVPLRGTTKKRVIRRAISNIRNWNEGRPDRGFTISVTFTIGSHNCDLEQLRKMVAWSVAQRIDLVRFNCFANFLKLDKHRPLEMTRSDIHRFFGYLAILHEEFINSETKLGISEDWGDAGIEQIYPYLPAKWQDRRRGWCRAGYRLFALIEIDGKLSLVGCVDKWSPVLGRVEQISFGEYAIYWDYDRIERLRQAILKNQVYACWGGVGFDRTAEAGFGTESNLEKALVEEMENGAIGQDREPAVTSELNVSV